MDMGLKAKTIPLGSAKIDLGESQRVETGS